MVKAVLVALLCVGPTMASAQDDEYYRLRFALAAGPAVARPSGNQLTLADIIGCATCGRTLQKAIGADEAKFHAGVNVARDIKWDLTIRGELMLQPQRERDAEAAEAHLRAKDVLVFAEMRRLQNYSTPGTAMAPFSLGPQYWARFSNYGY